ncbi:MAG: haloacid dehalogenase [Acidimicrobiia bacterium]|nr:haloacid dehalogenase [Acidimicrobiia bacterium]MDX2467317.1 haloacid dehalogenase [Acidimicrobiia bacterium]
MSNLLNLDQLEAEVRSELDEKFAARELALKNCRKIIQASSKAIRALHRGDVEAADGLLADGRALIDEAEAPLKEHRDIYHAGFFYDAVKEYAEAELTKALVLHQPLPLPSDLGLHAVPYLKGLGEAVGELRRRLLDQLRKGELAKGEATFTDMEIIHDLLAALDYPDGMTSSLRRTTDVARALIERSRADLTTTIVQERLRRQLEQH